MKEISEGNAGVIGLVTTAAFACLVWWYAMQGSSDTTIFIIIGIALLLMNIFALWCISNKTTNKNKKRSKK